MSAPWAVPRPAPYGSPAPDRADVIVIGGGPSGLATALCLAQAGTDVVLLEARDDFGLGFAARIAGAVALGTVEHPNRLVAGLGHDDTRGLFAFTRANLALSRDWLDAAPTGGVYAAGMPGEDQDLTASAHLLAQLGVQATPVEPSLVRDETGAVGLGGGLLLSEEASVIPASALHRLADLAAAQGARLHTGHRVVRVDEADELTVHLAGRSLSSQVVVWAAGAACQRLHPDFADVVWPVRIQSVAGSDPGVPAWQPHGHAQHGHLTFWRNPDGPLSLTGCRWATPHLEVGETDEHTLSPAVDAKLRGMFDRLWPGQTVSHAWAGIAAFTCDGLPLLGPLPGHPRQVACVGYGGADWSFALRAGHAVAQGLLTGDSTGVPHRFSLARFT